MNGGRMKGGCAGFPAADGYHEPAGVQSTFPAVSMFRLRYQPQHSLAHAVCRWVAWSGTSALPS